MHATLYPTAQRTGALWKKIPGHPNYEASYIGAVRHSADKSLAHCSITGGGYPSVSMNGKWMTVHRIVYLTFIGPLIKGLEVMHLDDDKLNPQVGNLKQGTRRENALMGVRLRGPKKAPSYDNLINQVLSDEYA